MEQTGSNAQLILENGIRVSGRAFAYVQDVVGDIVFVTNAVGYQEVLTNPAYAGKIVVMTYPLIGNYGIILDDMESFNSRVKALVVREKCDKPNNFRCEMELNGFLKQNKVLGLEGADTRFIAKAIRNCGSMKAVITMKDLSGEELEKVFALYKEPDMVGQITAKNEYTAGNGTHHIGVLDFGMTMSFLRTLIQKDFKVTVFPALTPVERIISSGCAALILSNGPGICQTTDMALKTVSALLGRMPVLGVGLGMNVAAKACSLPVKPLKYGRNGTSHPVKCLKSGRVYVTVQHERYYIDDLGENFETTHINLGDGSVAGIKHKTFPLIAYGFLPDAGDTACGTGFVFDEFKKLIEGVFIDA